MKAVILAGGRGSRMGALTELLPKALIKVGGKTLIEHVLDALPTCIMEYLVVMGYRGDDIKSFLGTHYKGRTISYIRQERGGTGGALYSAKTYLTGEYLFLVVGADDIFGDGELDTLLCGMASYGVTFGIPRSRSSFGVRFDDVGCFTGWYHDASRQTPRFYGVGAYVLPPSIFGKPFHCLDNGEYSIPHSLSAQSFPIKVCRVNQWLPVNTPEDIEYAEAHLKNK